MSTGFIFTQSPATATGPTPPAPGATSVIAAPPPGATPPGMAPGAATTSGTAPPATFSPTAGVAPQDPFNFGGPVGSSQYDHHGIFRFGRYERHTPPPPSPGGLPMPGEAHRGLPDVPGATPEQIAPIYADMVANMLGWGADDGESRQLLHALQALGKGLEATDLIPRLLTTGLVLGLNKAFLRLVERFSHLEAIIDGVIKRLDENFSLTPDQVTLVRRIVHASIGGPNCVQFTSLHIHVYNDLETNKVKYNLTHIFGHPGREQGLMASVKDLCRRARDALRTIIRDDTLGENPVDARTCTNHVMHRFLHGRAADHWDVVRIIIIRRLGLEKPTLFGLGEDGTEYAVPDATPAAGAQKRKRDGTFWNYVDSFFAARIKEWGNDWKKSPQWQQYIQTSTDQDTIRFPVPLDDVPFMNPAPAITVAQPNTIAQGLANLMNFV